MSNSPPLGSRCGILQTTAFIFTAFALLVEPSWCTFVETKKTRKKENPISWTVGYFGLVRIHFFTFKNGITI